MQMSCSCRLVSSTSRGLPVRQLSFSFLLGSSRFTLADFDQQFRSKVTRGKPSIVAQAAWTRKSKGSEPPTNRKSWKQRHEKYLKPFILDVYISNKNVSAKVMHRVTSRVVSEANTNSRDFKENFSSRGDLEACRAIGKAIAERSMDADVFAVAFKLRKDEKYEGKLAAVVDAAVEHGLTLV